MLDTVARAKERVTRAYTEMQAAHQELDEAKPGTDPAPIVRRFDNAEREHRVAVAALETAEAETSTAGGLNLPGPSGSTGTGNTRVRVSREPLTYERGNGRSVFADLARVHVEDDHSAAERIRRHREEMAVELRAHPSQAAGEGGEFIAPIWMQDEWIKLPRAGRAVADSLNRKPFPGTNQVNLPKIATGSATAIQTDGGAVQSTDVTTTSVTGQAQTIAGQEDVSMQLVDLSNPGVDEVLFDDLGRDYNQKVDRLVISSATTNAKGILEVAGANSVTFTSGSPTVPLVYPKIAKGISEVNTGIFRPPTVVAMHPRRWAWFLAALDTSNRPLITPYTPQNAVARFERVAPEAVVGDIQGLPVITDANLPVNEGAGTNQDPILIYSAEDLYLFEDDLPRLRVLKEVLSGTLQVRFQIYNYVILIAGRLPRAISKIQGTGLTEPAL